MKAMGCNEPGIKGYCAAYDSFSLAKLCAHYSGTTTHLSQELANLGDKKMRWFYMPVDQDEYLKEIWACRHSAYRRCGGFMVSLHRKS